MKQFMQKTYAAQPVRYVVAGGSAFLTEYGSFYVLFQILSVQVYVANSVSFCLGLFVSFVLNRTWTFSSGTYKRRAKHQAGMYVALAILNLFITNGIIGLLKAIGVDPRFGKIIAMATIVAWNFFIFKYLIFARHTDVAR
jgi:putative flippase GtrA